MLGFCVCCVSSFLGVHALTKFCEDQDIFPISCELDEKSYCELISTDLFPEYPKDLHSDSELLESRGVIPDSEPSQKEGNMRSVLGLPLLTYDMSVSGMDGSYGLPSEPPPLVNGDLLK